MRPLLLSSFAGLAGTLALAIPARAQAVTADSMLFTYVRSAPTGWVEEGREEVDGLVETLVRFPSPKGGDVTARLYAPAASRGRLAAIVMGHGAPGNGSTLAPRARYLARHGAVVLVVDAPFARRDPSQPLHFTARDSADLVQQVIDYRRGLDFLAARADVDSLRFGFVGGSHSAYVGALLAGAEPRLRAVALAMGDVGYVEHFRDADGAWNRYFDEDLPVAQVRAWVASLAPFDARGWMARTAAPGLLLQNALRDEAVPRHAATLLHDAAPPRADRRWYESGHRVPPEAFVDQLAFFAEHLGLTPPTASDAGGPYASPAPTAPNRVR